MKALHTINACFSGKHASRSCRFSHSSCISKNRSLSETKCFRRISFCQSQFQNDIKYFVTDKRRQLCMSWICSFRGLHLWISSMFGDTDVKGTLTMSLTNFSLLVPYYLNQFVGSGQTFSGLYDKVGLKLYIPEFCFKVFWVCKLFRSFLHKDIYTFIRLHSLNIWKSCHP